MSEKLTIKQPNIFGVVIDDTEEKDNGKSYVLSSSAKKRSFPSYSLDSGIEYDTAAIDSIIIHRILQKNCARDQRNQCLIDIFVNEAKIKAGRIDIANAARDSLIKYYV